MLSKRLLSSSVLASRRATRSGKSTGCSVVIKHTLFIHVQKILFIFAGASILLTLIQKKQTRGQDAASKYETGKWIRFSFVP